MAEPTRPDEEPTPAEQRAAEERAVLRPPTDEELSRTGEPTAEEIHTAAAADRGAAAESATTRPVESETTRAAETGPADTGTAAASDRAAASRTSEPVAASESAASERAASEPAAEREPVRQESAAAPTAVQPAPPAATQQEIAPATEPAPPRVRSNRLAGTAWVLLAAGLFQVLFFGANALVALAFGGAQAVVPQVQSIAGTSLAWLPVLLFFLLFELTVLLVNRAGRVAYVLASLIVGAIVYVLTVLLFSVIIRHTLGDANTLAQTFLNWEFILIGLVARETMLWTGLAIGSRGIRVRRRNREERERFDREAADARS